MNPKSRTLARINPPDLSFLLFSFFVFVSLFPSLRVLLVGKNTSGNIYEYLISALPDLFTLIILVSSCFFVYKNRNYFTIETLDKVIFFYFLFSTITGFLLAVDFRLSVYGFRLTYLPMLFYFFARAVSLMPLTNQRKLLDYVFYINIALAVSSVVLYFFFPEWIDYMMEHGNYKISVYFIARLTSLLWSTISYASVATCTLLFLYYKIISERRKILTYVFFAVTFTSLLLTVSRGGIISFFVGYLMLTFIYRSLRDFTISFLIMVIISFLLKMYFFGEVQGVITWFYLSVGETLEYSENLTRVQLWTLSIHDFFSRPWGYGLGKAGHVAHRFLLDSQVPAAVYSTDGWYLKLANETGIQGLLFFAFLLIVYFKNVILKLIKNIRSISSFYLVSFLAVLLQCIVSNVLDFFYFAAFFWMLIGLSVNYSKSLENAGVNP